MSRKKYPEVQDEEVFPIMKGYRMACCDCNLVHEIDLSVYYITKFSKDGSFAAKKKRGKRWRVTLKAKRNNHATGQLRRYRKKNND